MRGEKSFISPLIEIKKSQVSGKGMFAKEKISKGTILIKWGGNFLTKKQIESLKKEDHIIIQVDENLFSAEPRNKPEDDTYFINHSCNSNELMIYGVTFASSKDIKK